MDDLRTRFIKRAGFPAQPSLWELVEGVRLIPYARPSERTADGVVEEWVGTCSTKHALLQELLASRPVFELELVHRVYKVTPDQAEALFGEDAATLVPAEGIVDVHTYATVLVEGKRVRIDVTFPTAKVWDGRSDMDLACGEGTDYPAGDDPWALKEELVRKHCDSAVREPFIAALSR